jgi:hypothetical protein
MAQQLRILQSLWAMERRRADEAEWPLETQLNMIRYAGFDGAGVRFIDPVFAAQVTSFLREYGMIWEAQLSDQCQRSEPGTRICCAPRRRPRQPAAERAAAAVRGLHSTDRGLADEAGVAVRVDITATA